MKKVYEIEYWKWQDGSGWQYNTTIDNITTNDIDDEMDALAEQWFNENSNYGDKITARNEENEIVAERFFRK